MRCCCLNLSYWFHFVTLNVLLPLISLSSMRWLSFAIRFSSSLRCYLFRLVMRLGAKTTVSVQTKLTICNYVFDVWLIVVLHDATHLIQQSLVLPFDLYETVESNFVLPCCTLRIRFIASVILQRRGIVDILALSDSLDSERMSEVLLFCYYSFNDPALFWNLLIHPV